MPSLCEGPSVMLTLLIIVLSLMEGGRTSLHLVHPLFGKSFDVLSWEGNN